MAVRRRAEIAAVLRARIEHAVSTHALIRGDRLPSTREIGREMGADPRVVAAAYRTLASEGLVELRPRSGIFVAPQTLADTGERPPSPAWLAKVLSDGIEHGFSTRDFCDYLREAALARKLRVAVIATTLDQTAGMCRELRADYGLEASGVLSASLKRGAPIPNAVRRAHLLVTTEAHRALVEQLAGSLRKPSIVVSMRPSFAGDEWLLKDREVFVIGTDPRFLAMLDGYLAKVPGGENATMLIAGRDDLSRIPPGAPTYVTQSARELLGRTRIPGRLLPPARVFSPDCADEIVATIVRINTDS